MFVFQLLAKSRKDYRCRQSTTTTSYYQCLSDTIIVYHQLPEVTSYYQWRDTFSVSSRHRRCVYQTLLECLPECIYVYKPDSRRLWRGEEGEQCLRHPPLISGLLLRDLRLPGETVTRRRSVVDEAEKVSAPVGTRKLDVCRGIQAWNKLLF